MAAFFLEGRKTVKVLGALAFAAILVQALLGGLTVLFLLPPAVSSAHAALAEIVFALTAVVALMCSKTWKTRLATGGASSLSLEENPKISSNGEEARSAFRWVVAATAAVYVQIVLGAVMRHTGAGLAIPDFPTSFGGPLPTFEEISRPGVPIHLAHRLGALAVVVLVFLAARAFRAAPVLYTRRLRGPALPPQAFLGASSIWSAPSC